MKKIILLTLLLCGLNTIAQIPSTPGFHLINMLHDSVSREFLVIVPNSYNAATNSPLMFCFHGGTQDIPSFVFGQVDTINGGREELWEKADSHAMVLVFPQALVNSLSGSTLWNDKDLFPQVASPYDDLGFVLHMIDTLSQDLSIDSTRIYASGFSNGADFTNLIGSQLSCKFAAAAAVAGRTANQVSQIDTTMIFYPLPTTPVSMMIVRGKRDNDVTYNGGLNNGGINTTSVFDDMYFWLAGNACDSTLFTSTNMGDTVQVRKFYQCAYGSEVKVVSLKFMDHRWPDANDDFYWNANKEVINFCLQHSRNNCSTVQGISASEVQRNIIIYPNPTNGQVQINSNGENISSIKIYNLAGELLKEYFSSDFSIANLPSGVYFIKTVTDQSIYLNKVIKH